MCLIEHLNVFKIPTTIIIYCPNEYFYNEKTSINLKKYKYFVNSAILIKHFIKLLLFFNTYTVKRSILKIFNI